MRNLSGKSPIPLENDTEGLFVRCVNCGFVYEKQRESHRRQTSYTRPEEVEDFVKKTGVDFLYQTG